MDKKFAIGVDIGGSHISSQLVNLENGQIIEESYFEEKVNNQASAPEIITAWSKAIKQTLNCAMKDQIAGIGIAMPGPFNYEKGIALIKGVAKYESLYGLNITTEIRNELKLPKEIEIRYINDAISFAIGETWTGVGANKKRVVAITLGTGFGSSFVDNGVPVIEGESVPSMGYVYNIPYKEGIADDYFSTRWFVKEFKKRTGENCSGVKEIADKASSNPIASEIFEDFGFRLGIFLSPLLKKFDADCLVIGGNISKAYSLFGPTFIQVLKNEGIRIEVNTSVLMEAAAMVGSARLIEKDYWKKVKSLVAKI